MKDWKYLVLSLLLLLFFHSTVFGEVEAEDAENSSKDSSQVYHVFDDVYLLSALKVSYGKPKLVIKAVYPQLQSDNHEEAVEGFNQLVLAFVQQEIDGFASHTQQALAGKKAGKNDLYIDFATSVIQSGSHHIVSIRFNIQGFVANVRDIYHYHRVMNYDLENHSILELQDLFYEDVNFLDYLSEYAQNALERRLGNKPTIAEMTEAKEENFKNWNVKPNGLLITFDAYKMGSYTESTQTVLIPYSVIRKLIPHESPITGCIKQRWKCRSSNLVTGGFIDEAMNNKRTHTRA